MSSDTETADLSSSGPSAPGVSELAEVLGAHRLRDYDAPGEPECVACTCGWQWDWREVVLPSQVDFDPSRHRVPGFVRPEQHRRHVAEVIAASGVVVPVAEVRERDERIVRALTECDNAAEQPDWHDQDDEPWVEVAVIRAALEVSR